MNEGRSSPRIGYLIVWHALALLGLAALPQFLLQTPIWSLVRGQLEPTLILMAAYAACAGIAIACVARGRALTLLRQLQWTAVVFGLVLLVQIVAQAVPSRGILLSTVAAALILPALSVRLGRSLTAVIVILVAAGVAGAALAILSHSNPLRARARELAPSSETDLLKTAFYNLRERTWRNYIPAPAVRGGGLARIGDQVLLATGDGYLYLLGWPGATAQLHVEKLPYRVPVNGDEFAHDTTGGPWHKPSANDALSYIGEDAGNEVIAWWFRVAGLLTEQRGDSLRVYAAHYFWKPEQSCWVERVSVLEGARADFLRGAKSLTWRTVYDTKPCLPLRGAGRRRGTPFAGHFGGGRMVLMGPDTILLSVGDFGFNGVSSSQAVSQDPAADYGKTILIHVPDSHAQIYTSGHRNPQGLYRDADGTIWETEQGPQGGDELNLLRAGLNYGWPLVTFGTDYGAFTWPLDTQVGEHNGFELPMFAWLPDIGVSDLIVVQVSEFPVWRGDLLVASLANQKLLRVRIRGGHVVYVEPIPIGRRLRDVIEAADGRIVLWADDDDAIVSLQPANGSSGEIAFSTHCNGCHKVGDGTSHRIGPDLWGVLGRKVASAEGYGDYSAALRKLGGRWDEQRLDAFLKNPQAYAPGTAMEFGGIPDPALRAGIIDYIRHAPKVISR